MNNNYDPFTGEPINNFDPYTGEPLNNNNGKTTDYYRMSLIGLILSLFIALPGVIVSFIAYKNSDKEDKSRFIALMGIIFGGIQIIGVIIIMFALVLVPIYFSYDEIKDELNHEKICSTSRECIYTSSSKLEYICYYKEAGEEKSTLCYSVNDAAIKYANDYFEEHPEKYKEKITTRTTTTTKVAVEPNNNSTDVTNPEFNQVIVNGHAISLPSNTTNFIDAGLEIQEKDLDKTVEVSYFGTTVNLGKYPAYVTATIISPDDELINIKDGVVADVSFHNPKDGTNDVTFYGSITYNSSVEDVKKVMTNLGFTVEEREYPNSKYMTFYKDNDKSNYKDYIEYYFYKDVITSVSVNTGVN